MPKKSAEPWEKPAPKKSKHTKLTPASKAKAKASAKKAGRPYPSLVDNMNAAKEQNEKSSAAKKKPRATTKKAASKPKAKASKSKAPKSKASAAKTKKASKS